MSDNDQIIEIVSKIGMYCPPTRDGIIGFIYGYEVATGTRYISSQLEKLLTKKYRFKANSLGWPGLVEKYSIKCGVDWCTGFKMACSEFKK
jgi:hypothetical protein